MRVWWFVVTGALVALLAAWPFYIASRGAVAAAPAASPAPVARDYLLRPKTIAFYERRMREAPGDALIAGIAAGQFMASYREHGDPGDLARAERAARSSLKNYSRQNISAEGALASVMLSRHQFREALALDKHIAQERPDDSGAISRLASTEMELGNFPEAARLLRSIPAGKYEDAARDTIMARYEEVTGHLAVARLTLARAMQQQDSIFNAGAEPRAWYHWRAGELAFAAGDADEAIAQTKTALAMYPSYARAYTQLARIEVATHRWPEALQAATQGAQLIPQPDTLGYLYDAQRAMHDDRAAEATLAVIDASAQIAGPRVNDRLLAQFYCEHGIKAAEGLAIARRDLTIRDDMFAEDTLTGCAIANGKWDLARNASRAALRYGTEDARMLYHAGLVALHDADKPLARERFSLALKLNPSFHAVYADDARRLLESLR